MLVFSRLVLLADECVQQAGDLLDASGGAVQPTAHLSKPAIKTRIGKDRAFATITLPAGTLAKGDYILVLSGRNARGEQEEIDQYFFRVQ